MKCSVSGIIKYLNEIFYTGNRIYNTQMECSIEVIEYTIRKSNVL